MLLKTSYKNIMEKYIVFGFEHYNPLGIIRSLGESGIRPVVIVVRNKGNIAITSKSKYISQLYLVCSIEEGYAVLLDQCSDRGEKKFVFTADDQVTNFLDCHYEEIKDKFYFYNAGEKGRIALFQNKNNIIQLAIKHGLNVLKTNVVNRGEIPSELEYPVITKAIISTFDNWKDDMFICYNEQELRDAFSRIRSQCVLIQKYIEKKNELCLEGFSVANGKKSLITIASQYNYQLKDTYSPYMTVDNLKNEDIRMKLSDMLAEVGYEGIFEVEFLVDQNEELYFLEINFRNSTWSYASTVAGMPLPVLWSEGMLDNNIVEHAYREIEIPFTAMVEFDDFRRRVKTREVGLVRWMKEVVACRCRYYWCSGDYYPVCSILWAKFINKIKRRIMKKQV